ncbi:hypothetical protein AX774_g1773 [Zancudomyces culisetae]|uniref:Uncharacterized protein n=1 Tax=Zancudomyces culisetae TaxID=1213189 RepID=A0A1R1PUU4_ZANCU|nr:hypothetical protein AX774_g1773 [Zancudomyces culisetae]|eukprot:OMH84693.1 hypothetical protein AX774_g1773 [Zancudomyces culisetae]
MAVFRSKRGSSHSSMGSISNGYGGDSGNEIHSRRSTDTSRDSSITGANIKNDSRGVVGYLRDNASSNIHALNLRISGLMSNIRGFNPVRSASPDTESTKRGDVFLKGRSGGRRSSEDIDDLLLSSNSSDAYTSDCMHGKGDSYKFIRSSSATSDGASKGFLNRTEKHEGKAETAKTVYSKFKTPTKQSIARKAKSTMKQPEKFDLRGGGSIPQFDPSGHIKSSSSESMSSKSGNNHAVDTLSEASGYCFVEENDQAHPETKDQQTSSKQGPGSTLGNLKSTEAFKELVCSLPNLNVGLSEISVPKSQSNTHTSPTKVVASPSTNSNDSNKKSSLTSSTLEKKPPVIDDGDKDIDTEEFGVVPEASS